MVNGRTKLKPEICFDQNVLTCVHPHPQESAGSLLDNSLSSLVRIKQITSTLNINHRDSPTCSHTVLTSHYFRDMIYLKVKLKDNYENTVQ